MNRLNNGQIFPPLEIPAVGGGVLKLPEAMAGVYGVVLIYRGAWCPFCNAQLAAFQRAGARFAELGVKVAAFSVDDEATTAALAAKHQLTFPLGHSAGADHVAGILGCYVNPQPHYLQTTGFLLAPNGAVLNAVYSSGPIGRLVAEDVAGMVAYVKSKG